MVELLKNLYLCVVLICLTYWVGASQGQLRAAESADEDRAVGFGTEICDELDLFADLPIVITASRQEATIWNATAATSVLDAETISMSGWNDLSQIIKFQPGMDHLNIDRRRYALGIQGQHDFSSNRTLYLVDGMPTHNPLFQFTNFNEVPVITDSIERIETVRSPGSASWGANAFSGVVNVITREPGADLGWHATGQINDFGDQYASVKWEAEHGALSSRVHVAYESIESSAAVLDEDFTEDDYQDTLRLNLDTLYRFDGQRSLRIGVQTLDQASGSAEFILLPTDEESSIDRQHLYARYRDNYSDDAYYQVQTYLQFMQYDGANVGTYDSVEFGVDAEWQQELGAQSLMLGANAVQTHFDNDPNAVEDVLIGDGSVSESSLGLFLVDKIAFDDSLDVELQLRADTFSDADDDWSARLSVLKELDDEGRYLLRCAVARAFRVPAVGWRETNFFRYYSSPPAPGPLDGQEFIRVISNDDLKNEGVQSAELGLRLNPIDEVHVFIDAFYHAYEHLARFDVSSVDLLPGAPQLTFETMSGEGANLFGLELEAQYRVRDTRASVWYSYHDWSTDEDNQSVRAFAPAKHKIGARVRQYLGEQDTIQLSVVWVDETAVDPLLSTLTMAPEYVDAQLHLDLNYRHTFHNGQVQLGVLEATQTELDAVPTVGSTSEHEIPGRSFYMRFDWNY